MPVRLGAGARPRCCCCSHCGKNAQLRSQHHAAAPRFALEEPVCRTTPSFPPRYSHRVSVAQVKFDYEYEEYRSWDDKTQSYSDTEEWWIQHGGGDDGDHGDGKWSDKWSGWWSYKDKDGHKKLKRKQQ